MTDAQLCEYLDSLAAGQRPAGPTKEEIINDLSLIHIYEPTRH